MLNKFRPTIALVTFFMTLLGIVGMLLDYEQAALVIAGGLVGMATDLVKSDKNKEE
jgi:hypothetical protein